jgi:site-specific DNA-cytosine methylase
MSPNLPNIKQSDLFQWCYKMFNWVIVVDDNKGQVEISTYDLFYQNGGQKDFSQKLSLTPNAIINYQPTNFSRKYDFRYKHDEKDYWLTRYDLKQTTDQPYRYGDGQYYLTPEGEAILIGEVGFSPTIIEKSWNGNDPDYIYLPTMLDIAQPTIFIDRAAFNQGENAKYEPVISDDPIISSLVARGPHAVFTNLAVRRLTPLECERLQGWPDDHTRWRADGKEQVETQRYKQCGNGVATPVAAWVAKHVKAIL